MILRNLQIILRLDSSPYQSQPKFKIQFRIKTNFNLKKWLIIQCVNNCQLPTNWLKYQLAKISCQKSDDQLLNTDCQLNLANYQLQTVIIQLTGVNQLLDNIQTPSLLNPYFRYTLMYNNKNSKYSRFKMRPGNIAAHRPILIYPPITFIV